MRLPTQRTTKSPLVRQPVRDDRFHRSVRTGERAWPLMCSAKEQHSGGRYHISVRGNRTADYPLRIMATNLFRETLIICGGCSSEAPAVEGQRINSKFKQGIYEFQLEKSSLKPWKERNVLTAANEADGTLAMKASFEGKDNGTALRQGREHKMEEGYHESFDTNSSTNWRGQDSFGHAVEGP